MIRCDIIRIGDVFLQKVREATTFLSGYNGKIWKTYMYKIMMYKPELQSSIGAKKMDLGYPLSVAKPSSALKLIVQSPVFPL